MFAAGAVWSWVGIMLAEAGRFRASWLLALAGSGVGVAAVCAWRRHPGDGTAPLVGARHRGTGRRRRLGGGAFRAAGRVPRRRRRRLGLPEHRPQPGPPPRVGPSRTAARTGAAIRLGRGLPSRAFRRGLQPVPRRHPGVPGDQRGTAELPSPFPVWLAMADVVAGPLAPYYVSPLFGVVAIVAFWLLARALTTPLVATLAAMLLVANLAQAWFARVPTTEIMAQAFTLSGIYFACCATAGPTSRMACWPRRPSAWPAFIRIDMLVFSMPAVVVLSRRGRAGASLGRSLDVVRADPGRPGRARRGARPPGVDALHRSPPVFRVPRATRSRRPAACCRPWCWRPARLPSCCRGAPTDRRWRGRLALLVFVGILAGAAYRIWPQVTGGYLMMLMNPLGVGLALAGAVVWITGDRSAPTLLVIGLLLTSALVYGESVRDRSAMPTLFRRFVPVVLPLSALCVGVLVDRLWRRGTPWRVAATAAWAVLLALWASQARPLMAATPMAGVHAEFARLAAALPADVIVVTDQTTPSHFGLSLEPHVSA